jgi:hypothetical protein
MQPARWQTAHEARAQVAPEESRSSVRIPGLKFADIVTDFQPAAAPRKIDEISAIGQHLIAEKAAQQRQAAGALRRLEQQVLRVSHHSRRLELPHKPVGMIEEPVARDRNSQDRESACAFDRIDEFPFRRGAILRKCQRHAPNAGLR